MCTILFLYFCYFRPFSPSCHSVVLAGSPCMYTLFWLVWVRPLLTPPTATHRSGRYLRILVRLHEPDAWPSPATPSTWSSWAFPVPRGPVGVL